MADASKQLKLDQSKEPKKSKQSDGGKRVKKRCPNQLPRRSNDVYVNNKTPIQAVLSKCELLLEKEPEIFIYGLGAAVANAINVALQLKHRSFDTLQVAVNTSSQELIDDIEPETDSLDAESQKRLNSAVHIKVWKITKEI